MSSQFPDVVELRVAGNNFNDAFVYTALLSTLRKDEDSVLAQMFRGEVPVYKDSKDRYVLEGDGRSFGVILDYLIHDELPVVNTSLGGVFGTRSLFDGPFTTSRNYVDIIPLYQTAVKYNLKRLVQHLEQHSQILFQKKMEEFRQSRKGYDECLAQIIDAIPPEDFLMKSEVAVRIKQESFDAPGEPCCEHTCRQWHGARGFGFGMSPQLSEVDVTVTVPCEVDSPLLASLCYSLLQRNFDVQGRETYCYFVCSRNKSGSGFVRREETYCCRQIMYIINFNIHNRSNVGHGQLFGQQKTGKSFQQPAQAFTFGAKQEQPGLFGSSNQPPQFGSNVKQPAPTFGFSNQGSGGGLFGSSSNQNNLPSGFGSPYQECFGHAPIKQSQGLFGSSGFGQTYNVTTTSSQNQQGAFSFGQQAVPPAKSPFPQTTQSSVFGSPFGKPTSGHTFGGPPSFPKSPSPGTTSKDTGGLFGALCISDVEEDKPPTPNKPQGFSFGAPTSNQSQAFSNKSQGFSNQSQGFCFGASKK